jgi:hypothetical protein
MLLLRTYIRSGSFLFVFCFRVKFAAMHFSGIKLHEYAPPKSKLFTPRNKTSEPAKRRHALIQQPVYFHSPASGNATPIPGSSESLPLSPAWDPSSRTPLPNFDYAESLATATSSSPHHLQPRSRSNHDL